MSLQIFLCLSQNFCLHLWHKTTMFKCQLCYQKRTVSTVRVQPLILPAVIDVLFAINSELFRSLSFFSGNNAVHWILSPLKQRCSCLISTLSFFWGRRAQCFAVPGCGPRCKTASMLLSGCIDFRRPRGPIASPWPRLRKAGRDERKIIWNDFFFK